MKSNWKTRKRISAIRNQLNLSDRNDATPSLYFPSELFSNDIFEVIPPVVQQIKPGEVSYYQSRPLPDNIKYLDRVRIKSVDQILIECIEISDTDKQAIECLKNRLSSAESFVVETDYTLTDFEFGESYEYNGQELEQHKHGVLNSLINVVEELRLEVKGLSKKVDKGLPARTSARGRASNAEHFDDDNWDLMLKKKQHKWLLPEEAFDDLLLNLYFEDFVTRKTMDGWQDIFTDHFVDPAMPVGDHYRIDWIGKWSEYAVFYSSVKPFFDVAERQKGHVFFSIHFFYKGAKKSPRAVKDSCAYKGKPGRDLILEDIVRQIRRTYRISDSFRLDSRSN